MRLTVNGAPDGTFGSSGWVVTDFGNGTVSSDDGAAALLLTENETLTAIGHVRRGGGLRSIGLARYHIGNPDRDGDGVPNAVEDAHPDKLGTTEFGDGDADSHRDADQDRAASLPAAVAGAPYVTITSEPLGLRHVQAIVGDATLLGATRPVGTFSFQILGAFADVGFHLPALPGGLPDHFLAFGPTSDDPVDHWYEVPLVGNARGTDIRFRVHDGGLGDSDRRADGVITVVGAPVQYASVALSISGSVFNDLDGDGLLDLAFPPEPALSGWRVFLDDGNGRWDAGEAWAFSDDESAYAFVDDDTLAAGAFTQEPSNGGLKTYLNLERRTYRVAAAPFDPQPGWISTLPPAYQSLDVGAGGRAFTDRVVTGDVDGDGDNDLVALAAQLDAVPARRIHVFRNRGDGRFDPDSGLSNLLDDANADDVVIGLFNNDSYPDIAVTSSTGALSLVDVYLADGQGGFLAPLNSAGMGEDLTLVADAADMDEDGKLDLVVGTKHLLDDPQRTEKGRVGFLRGIGNGRFEPARIFDAPEFSDVRPITELSVGEFTGDGHADVVTTMVDHAGYQLWVGDGDGGLVLRQGLPPGFPEDPLFRRLTLTPPLATVFGAQPTTFVSGFFDNEPGRDYVIRGVGPGDIAVIPSMPPLHLARLGGDPQPVLLFGERPLFGGAVRGTVLYDSDGDGTPDAGEPWARGTRVVLDLNGNGAFDLGTDRAAIARADGSYSFDAVPPGEYDLFVRLDPGYEATAPLGGSARLVVGDAVVTQDFAVRAIPGTVRGTLWIERDFDGVPDPDETRPAGVRVWIDLNLNGTADAGEPAALTGTDGSYSLLNVPPGDHLVSTDRSSSFSDPGGASFGFSVGATGRLIVVGDPGVRHSGGFSVLDAMTGSLVFRQYGSEYGTLRDEVTLGRLLILLLQLAQFGAYQGNPAEVDDTEIDFSLPDSLGFAVATSPDRIAVSSLGDTGSYTNVYHVTGAGAVEYVSTMPGSFVTATVGDPLDPAFAAATVEGMVSHPGELVDGEPLPPRTWSTGQFAESIAGAGPGTIVIGSPSTGPAGAAFLFDFRSTQLLRRFDPPNPAPGDGFGTALAVIGNDLIVGAPTAEEPGDPAGAGVVYVMDLTSGQVRWVLRNPSPHAGDHFGFAVATGGNLVFVGAPQDDTVGQDAGAVYVFDRQTGRHLRTVYSPAPLPGAQFGYSLADGGAGRFVVGAPSNRTTDPGAAYVFPAGATVRVMPRQESSGDFPVPLFDNSPSFGPPDQDSDGVPDATERQGHNSGDGNADGVPDSVQKNVASLGAFLTVAAPEGTELENVRLISPSALPLDPSSFHIWLVGFSADVAVGGSLPVAIYDYGAVTSPSFLFSNYRKYGPTTPGDPSTAAWYTLPGVTFESVREDGILMLGIMRFTLVDGQLGDATGTDGRIVDPGGLALTVTPTAMLDLAYLGGTRWTQPFHDAVWRDGLGHQRFGFTADAADPWAPLPWANLDKVSLRFDRPVTATLQDLVVRGAGGTYPVTGFAYDERTRTATWTLGRALAAGYVALELAQRVTGVPLAVPIAVLPGDVTRDGRVDGADLRQVRATQGRRAAATAPGVPAGYAAFEDVTGDGRVNVIDVQVVRANYLRSLPPVVEAPPVAGAAARRRPTVRGELFATTGVIA